MKRIAVITILGLVLALPASAQDDARKAAQEAAEALLEEKPVEQPKPKRFQNWTTSMLTNLSFGQTSLTNWAAGGDDTYSMKGMIDAIANYNKSGMFWNNRVIMEYGFIYASSKPILQKNSDRFQYESTYGYQVGKKVYLSAKFKFDTQFSKGWNYGTPGPAQLGDKSLDDLSRREQVEAWKDARVAKSNFLSPADASLGLGIDWKPWAWLSVNVAPATGSFRIVEDPMFRMAYGMAERKEYKGWEHGTEEQQKKYKELKESGELYRNARFELGTQVKMDANVKINNNFNYISQLVLFSNYLKNPQNVRVDWDNRFTWSLAKYFTFMISARMIYDDTVLIKSEKDIDKYPNGVQRLQFMESLSLGFQYTFAKK